MTAKTAAAPLALVLTLFSCVEMAPAQVRNIPDPAVTPGAYNPAVTQDDIGTTICVPGWTRTVRPALAYTDALKRRQLAALGIAGHMRDYELDHLVPLEAGGAPADPRNLWVEPWGGPWNAHLKDRLENQVHRMICQGSLSLDEGRRVFQGDWRQGYCRYVGCGR